MSDWIEFPNGGKEVLTTISVPCSEGHHAACIGLIQISGLPLELRGQKAICVCVCHLVHGAGNLGTN